MSNEIAVLPKALQGSPREERILPSHPFYALRYHFGMLLGVEDFETEQAYHRGKHRLHAAWLHREGVVWGLEVTAPEDGAGGLRGEIQIDPGLALDAAGCELHLDHPVCLSVPRWYEDRVANEAMVGAQESADGLELWFTAHVVASFRACLMRPVPSMTEPCEGTSSDTEFSRAFETVEILMRPGDPPEEAPPPYHRLRLLFGLDEPRTESDGEPTEEDNRILDARREILEITDAAARAVETLGAFRRLAARDVIDLRNPASLNDDLPVHFPAEDRTPVLLATLKIRMVRSSPGAAWRLDSAGIDNERRQSHVATRTIQELLCASLGASGAAPGTVPEPAPEPVPEPPPPAPPAPPSPTPSIPNDAEAVVAAPEPDAGGPRAIPESFRRRGRVITFKLTQAIERRSVTPRPFRASLYDPEDGWVDAPIADASRSRWNARLVRVVLEEVPVGQRIRLLVRGTSDWPMLDHNFIPFAGAVGGPPGSRHQGNDATFMLRIRS